MPLPIAEESVTGDQILEIAIFVTKYKMLERRHAKQDHEKF
jgi:hypothetical protein